VGAFRLPPRAIGFHARVAAQHGVDDAFGEGVRQFTTEHEPKVDGSDEQLSSHVDVDVGTQVTSCDAALDDPANLGAAGLDDVGAERIAQPGIDGDLGQDGANDRTEGRIDNGAHGIGDRGQQFGTRIAGLVDGDVRRGEVHQQREDQGFTRFPAAVDGGFADARAGGNVFKAQVGIAVLDEQLLGGPEDGAVGAIAARAAAARLRSRSAN